ncbi:30S ribosomal protein S3ae [Methanohalophilus portucalensis]|uniref:Small ribosomal subunit protein eS1 n=3 Tax=Methanohalophilus portucalensis TaxID=39664 RepID=A0A1X7NTP3_9EURY|nr:30S ribosomal protein S3ae [Methanohalophilus portucalensis]ATU07760.1 30S ribosomal protein S3ae [Methanohalophilus portucalensis]RNI11473.1 30S ribosomal protein S3ae [Methanohalophilus portucalensis FDF-1]SMH40981.1 SSU ribosomal protein S3AE [Methanohalophilus portucalensis FDF-1]
MARKVQRKLDKWKNKTWYNIETPEFIGRTVIGTTTTDESEKLVGRTIETTVGDITNDFSKQNIKLRLAIDSVTGDTANTAFIGHEITTDYLRSIVKRQTSRIDNNLEVTTKDGRKLRIKPIAFTVKRARSSQIRAIREIMAKIVLERSAELDFEHIVEEIVTGKLAANIYRNAKTIYPIRRVEIRKTEVLPVKANASAAA